MERVKTLIDKLVEQANSNVDTSAMLLTVQLLQAELSAISAPIPNNRAVSGKVAVVLPSFHTIAAGQAKDAGTNAIQQEVAAPEPPAPREVWTLDPVMEIPTLAHQDEIKELNEKMGHLNGESLNDRLKTARTEIASLLTEAPVRDLKKAISINDRAVYLNELFRGDVDMYERSLKTINNFRILPEAEYWIERELKIKLGWDESSVLVQQFNQLVKRRFC